MTTDELAARADYFSAMLEAPATIDLSISRPLAELIAEALIEYAGKRSDYPLDAQRYYAQQVDAVRRMMPGAFPVTYRED